MSDGMSLGDEQRLRERIAAEAIERAQEPVTAFREFLQAFFQDSSDEEALASWRSTVVDMPWYASDALNVLELILADPPADIVEILVTDGWVKLFHKSETPWRQYSRDEYLTWLAGKRDELLAVYNSTYGEE